MRTLPDASPGTPDTRGPWRYLLWILRCHWLPFALSCLFNVLWVTSMGVSPGLIGQAINAGLIARNQTALLGWGLALFGVGAVQVLATAPDRRLPTAAAVCKLTSRTGCSRGQTVGPGRRSGSSSSVFRSKHAPVGMWPLRYQR